MFAAPRYTQTLLIIYLLVMQRARSFRTAFTWRPSVRFLSKSINEEATDIVKPTWLLRFDGGSRGNPGLGGAGAVIYNYMKSGELNEIWRGYFFIDRTGVTNNQAEYTGLVQGLAQCKKMDIQSVCIQGDSELVLRQVLGIYRVKHLKLIPLHRTVMRLLKFIPVKTFQHIPRAQNVRADELSNMAMDRLSSMQAFSPEFSALLEQRSEEAAAATRLAAGEGISKGATQPVKAAEVEVKKRRGRPPASVSASIRSMEQKVDVRTLPDPVPILKTVTAVQTTTSSIPTAEKPVVKKTRVRKVLITAPAEAAVLSVSEMITPSPVVDAVHQVVAPVVEPVESIVKKTRTRKSSKANAEVVDGAVASR